MINIRVFREIFINPGIYIQLLSIPSNQLLQIASLIGEEDKVLLRSSI